MNQTYPKFFDDDRVPIRIMAEMKLPEIYRGRGKWEPYTDVLRVLAEANPVTREQLDALVREWDASLPPAQSQGPASPRSSQ